MFRQLKHFINYFDWTFFVLKRWRNFRFGDVILYFLRKVMTLSLNKLIVNNIYSKMDWKEKLVTTASPGPSSFREAALKLSDHGHIWFLIVDTLLRLDMHIKTTGFCSCIQRGYRFVIWTHVMFVLSPHRRLFVIFIFH